MLTGRLRKLTLTFVAGLVLVALGALLILWLGRPAVTEDRVREVVITTLQREAPESFLVTGSLEMAATISSSSTKYLLPSLLNLNLGTTESTLRCPGKVSYGFDIHRLDAQSIRLADDGTVLVEVPQLELYSVEPYLESLELETTVGWARLYRESGISQERRVLSSLRNVLRDQAAAYLDTSNQPAVFTARALETMLTLPLESLGIEAPRIRVSVAPGLTYEPETDE